MHFSVLSFLTSCVLIGLSQGGELLFPGSSQLLHPQHTVAYTQPIAYSVPLAYSAINPAFYSHQSFVTPSHYSIANFLAQQQQQLLNQYNNDPGLFTHHQLSFPSIIDGQLPLEGESSPQSPALPVEPSSTSSPSSDTDAETVTEPPQNSPQSPILNRPEGATTVDDDDTVSIESAK